MASSRSSAARSTPWNARNRQLTGRWIGRRTVGFAPPVCSPILEGIRPPWLDPEPPLRVTEVQESPTINPPGPACSQFSAEEDPPVPADPESPSGKSIAAAAGLLRVGVG